MTAPTLARWLLLVAPVLFAAGFLVASLIGHATT